MASLRDSEVSHQRWTAIRYRDPAANSLFIYGVKSTMIFCRPTCPGRVARRSNIVYFDDVDAARHARYRPCKRCDPCSSDWHPERQSKLDFERAQRFLTDAAGSGEEWTVTGIAEMTGVSVGHLHRLFKKFARKTPKQVALDSTVAPIEKTLHPLPVDLISLVPLAPSQEGESDLTKYDQSSHWQASSNDYFDHAEQMTALETPENVDLDFISNNPHYEALSTALYNDLLNSNFLESAFQNNVDLSPNIELDLDGVYHNTNPCMSNCEWPLLDPIEATVSS